FAFMGIPVTLSVFGPEAAIYTSVIQIPANLLSYTVGVRLVAPKNTKLATKKLIFNPPCIAAVIAFILYFTRVSLPGVVLSSIELLAGITTPGAMLIIGMTLASFPLKGLFSDWRLYLTSILRLIVIPAAAYFVLDLIVADKMFVSVVTLQVAMGSATISSMLAIQYGGNADLAGKGVFLTTALSALTIPVWAIILR
ncbi:MAG: AEC family transporter, partial [Oscillospiraceae bacterium]|nr:AEC family transporter [Oscillospiraceae bacterium]